MNIKSAQFKISVSDKAKLLMDLPEFAFVGRSNVGKSSLINYIANQKKLAKTSSTPGHTKLINYFLINNNFYFVDLPGYGFHKAGKSEQNRWSDLVDNYFEYSKKLCLVFVLLDIRHDLSILDSQMLDYLNYNRIPYSIILTKADKLSKREQNDARIKFANQTKLGTDNITICSTQDRIGKDNICQIIENILETQ